MVSQNCCQVRMAQHVGWRMVGDLRLPNARRVVSEAFRILTLKIVVVKMPPDISTPQDAAHAIDQTQRVSRTLQPPDSQILHRSVVQRALPTRDFLTFFPTHLLVFFAVGMILCQDFIASSDQLPLRHCTSHTVIVVFVPDRRCFVRFCSHIWLSNF